MVETFCTSGSVKLDAGTNAPTLTSAQYTTLINRAEAALNDAAKIPDFNLVDNFAAMNTDVKLILEDGASNHAAVSVINSDPSGYTSHGEATFMANVCWTKYIEAVKLIKEKSVTDFMRKQT